MLLAGVMDVLECGQSTGDGGFNLVGVRSLMDVPEDILRAN